MSPDEFTRLNNTMRGMDDKLDTMRSELVSLIATLSERCPHNLERICAVESELRLIKGKLWTVGTIIAGVSAAIGAWIKAQFDGG